VQGRSTGSAAEQNNQVDSVSAYAPIPVETGLALPPAICLFESQWWRQRIGSAARMYRGRFGWLAIGNG